MTVHGAPGLTICRDSRTGAWPVQGFLPDFCDNRTVFLTVLIVELLAFALALTSSRTLAEFWTELALKSLFMQWVALMATLVLCRCRHWLARLHPTAVTLAAFGITQFCTLLCSVLAWRLVSAASFDVSSPHWLATLVIHQAISGIFTLLALRYFYVQHQWQQNVRAEARARLRALQARIHPHFLFNTLNTIASLIRGQPDRAEQAVLDLSDLLRSALAQHESITLAEELELTGRYLAIEKLRLGERLQVDWWLDADLPLDLTIPALLLQPLVENAIHHGIQCAPEGGTLTIRIEQQTAALRFTVSNPQPTISGTVPASGQRLAQDNIRQRLRLAYAIAEPLIIVETPECYKVSLILPLPSLTTL
jgi:two-component system, LytTR family, sensor histidine kinase AlgZ